MLNEKVKVLWTDALNSGKYEQGIDVLKNGNKYCCLGVLCDLHSIEFKNDWDVVVTIGDRYLGNDIDLPKPVAKWAGLKTSPYVVDKCDVKRSLTDINDEGVSFKDLVKLINNSL